MIKYNYEVSVNENRAKLNKDIFLFRGNRNIHYYFSIKGARFTFSKENEDLLESSNAIYAAVTVVKPNGVEVANAIAPVEDGLIHLKVTEDLIDEEVEVGDFDLVFDLFDDNEGAVTIPKIKGQFHVQERPCTTSIGILSGNVNVVNQAVVDLAIATQENEQLIVVDDDGKYVKTTWAKGDKISVERLNKMEEGIYNNSSRLKNIGTGGSTNASDITITDVNDNFESANVEGALNELGTQYKDIANLFSTEQTANSYKIKCGNKVIAEIPLGSTTPKYTITNTLSHAINNNNTTEIEENQSYTATITASEGYSINSVVITMGGADITNNVYNEGNINIPKVTGNLVINVSAIIIPKDFIKDGLLFNLELRNRTSENNSATPPTIVDTINNKECVTHNIDWDGKTSGFVDNGLLLKDPSTIEGANSFKEQTYSTLEIPKFDDTYDFSNGFTIEFTLSGHKGRGIARSYGTANGVYGISLFHISRHLAEYFNEYIDTENKFQKSQLTFQMPTSDIVYNEDEHTYSISVDNNLNASSYLDGQLMDTINTATVSNFKKLFFPEVIKVSSLFVGFLYQNTDSRNFILSEMRLYNKVLSGDEIYSNYNKTLSLQTLSNFQ